MSALSNNAYVTVKRGQDVTREVASGVAVYGGSFAQSDTNGLINPVSSSAGRFEGILQSSGGAAADTILRKVYPAKQGAILATLTGVTMADLGKPVFAPTDNPNDLTLTFSAGAKLVGFIDDFEYNALGEVANQAWVYFDARWFGNRMQEIEKTQTLVTAAGTKRLSFYRVPTGKNAQLTLGNWWQRIKPNYATSSTLKINKISGATRTNLITAVDVNNTGSLDTPASLTITSVVQTLVAGDILEIEIITVGSETAAGEVSVSVNLFEYSKI